MSKERLFEILSTIDKLEGPLFVLGYLTSLDNAELIEILKMIDKEKANNFYDGIKLVASTYMKDKPALSDKTIYETLGYSVYKGEENKTPMFDSRYAEMMFCDSNYEKKENNKSKK